MDLYTYRRITSITLAITWFIAAITGVILYLSRILTYLGYTVPLAVVKLHVISGFLAFALSVIHIAFNWQALVSYVKPKKKKSS